MRQLNAKQFRAFPSSDATRGIKTNEKNNFFSARVFQTRFVIHRSSHLNPPSSQTNSTIWYTTNVASKGPLTPAWQVAFKLHGPHQASIELLPPPGSPSRRVFACNFNFNASHSPASSLARRRTLISQKNVHCAVRSSCDFFFFPFSLSPSVAVRHDSSPGVWNFPLAGRRLSCASGERTTREKQMCKFDSR